ncbi:unnamed protein product [Ectocarpus sp. CCAP 1310/34]|nr:unnamed protein product [Ectocarpus sp. CCAP 1310/34]
MTLRVPTARVPPAALKMAVIPASATRLSTARVETSMRMFLLPPVGSSRGVGPMRRNPKMRSPRW